MNIQYRRLKLLLSIFAVQLIVFFILRTVFLVESWHQILHTPKAFLHIYSIGLIYDLIFLLYFNAIIALYLFLFPQNMYQKKFLYFGVQVLFSIMLSLFLFFIVAEWFFWDEFNVRFNFIAVDYLIYGTEVIKNIKESYPIKTILFLLFLTSSFILYFPRKLVYQYFTNKDYFKFRALVLGGYFLLLIPLVFFVNQNLREISPNNFMKELSSNGPYQFVFSYFNNKINFRQFYKLGDDMALSSKLVDLIGKEEIVAFRKNHPLNDDTKYSDKVVELASRDSSIEYLYNIARESHLNEKEEKRFNVILISVESLSASFMKRFGNDKNITPFLDKLLESSLLFSNFYATGTRTVRGLESISLGIPPTPGQAIIRRPDNKGFHSLGSIFREHGYESVFFYGGNGYFDNMNDFFSGNGYRIIDKLDFQSEEKTFENAWGLADEDLFNRSLKEADKSFENKQCFFYHIMTVSNHKPYTYPDNKIDIPSHTSRDGAVKYTDYAIKKFMEESQKKMWYSNTLFVIVADHCASSAGKIGLNVKTYHIPLIIHCPSLVKAGENSKLSSQIDIAPTILKLLNFKYKNCFFGDDILSVGFKERAFISNYQKMGYLKNNTLCILSPNKLIDFYSFSGNEINYLNRQDQNILDETMAYYQGADFILENRIFRTNPAPQ